MESYRLKDFTAYHARTLTIDPARPWQIITKMGCLLGYKATREEAVRAVDALQEDFDAGRLPNNVAKWDKAYLLD